MIKSVDKQIVKFLAGGAALHFQPHSLRFRFTI